jgi:hypothetical protein
MMRFGEQETDHLVPEYRDAQGTKQIFVLREDFATNRTPVAVGIFQDDDAVALRMDQRVLLFPRFR